MTLSTTTVKNSYTGNASTTAFNYTFSINSTAELVVIERSAAGVETVKALTTHYTIADAGSSGGTVTFGTAPASGVTVVLIRDTSLTQETDYVANDPFPAETHEDTLDKLQMQIQEVQEEVDRSMKLSRTNTMTSTEFTNSATDRASKVLAFDSSGELSVTQELGTFRGTSATTTTAAHVIRDLVKGSTTAQLNNIYICIQASPIGTALTNTSFWTLIVDAVSAATSATTATNKATAAASSATAAAASETAAETAEAAAETAQTAAEAALDSFDDRYLGAKSSNPSTDNDGDALLTGALYFNSSTSQLFNWTASDAWEAIKPTSTEQTAINALAASAVIADMAILATDAIVADMAILATDAIVADMAILGTDAIVADMAILGTADVVTDMNVLGTADVVVDMNVLGTSANVTAMGLLGTAAVVEDLSILGTSTVVSNMATLAGSGNAPSVTNITASGTVTFGSITDGTITITDFVDEDNMASNSAVKIPTQQSVKAYVDGAGTGGTITSTGALDGGTITSGFGNIDTGASTITTTGAVATGVLSVTGAITATDGSTITTADNTDTLTLISTDADGASGPILKLFRNSASAADGDNLGFIKFFGKEESNGDEAGYVQLQGKIVDSAAGSPDGALNVEIVVNDSGKSAMLLGPTEAVFNNDSIDIDFRIESDNADYAFFVQGSDGFVGLGTAPDVELHLKQTNDHPELKFENSKTATTSGDFLGKILFHGNDATTNASGDRAFINAAIANTSGATSLSFGTGDSTTAVAEKMSIKPNGFIHTSNGISTGGETAADVGAGGLCIDQNAIDTGILSFKSSDIAHGITNVNETDTYGDFRKHNATEGGLQVRGTSESASPGFVIDGVVSTSSDNSNTGAEAPVHITGRKQNGTTTQVMGAANNLVAVRNSGDTKFIIKGDGEIFSDQSATVGTYDTYEDAQLVRSLELSRGSAMTGLINSQFDKYIKYNHETLAEANLVGREKDGTPNHFVNITGMQRLHNGAIWQQYETTQKLTQAMFELAKETLGEEKAKAILEKHEVKLLN